MCAGNDGNVIVPLPVVDATRWIVRVELLCSAHEPLDSLNVLPLGFVVQDVSNVLRGDLLSTGTRMNADHGRTERPEKDPRMTFREARKMAAVQIGDAQHGHA